MMAQHNPSAVGISMAHRWLNAVLQQNAYYIPTKFNRPVAESTRGFTSLTGSC